MSISSNSTQDIKAGITDSVNQMVSDAKHASSEAVHYMEREPLKSVLIAAGVGASVAVLLSLVLRPHSR